MNQGRLTASLSLSQSPFTQAPSVCPSCPPFFPPLFLLLLTRKWKEKKMSFFFSTSYYLLTRHTKTQTTPQPTLPPFFFRPFRPLFAYATTPSIYITTALILFPIPFFPDKQPNIQEKLRERKQKSPAAVRSNPYHHHHPRTPVVCYHLQKNHPLHPPHHHRPPSCVVCLRVCSRPHGPSSSSL